MPQPGSRWPPETVAPAYNAYAEWSAWWRGDPDELVEIYSTRFTATDPLPRLPRTRPTQYMGGIIGTISRWLWGAPPPPTTRDTRIHIPLPADLAATAAGLLFSEEPSLKTEDKNVQARLDDLQAEGFATHLRHAAEAASALGDVYLRPVIDPQVSPDRALVSVVHADGAIPVIRWGHLIEVTFWHELPTVTGDAANANHFVRLLEHHEVGRIVYKLFRGSSHNLGEEIPLTSHPEAAWLVEDGVVGDDGVQPTGLNRLDVVRIPNPGAQRRWRCGPGQLKYLGLSDFDGNEQIFDAVDGVWTSWLRDVRLARSRILVPAPMLEDLGPGHGAYWDPDREVFTALKTLPDPGSNQITINQFEIRWQQHQATITELVKQAMRHARLSSQTLGEDPTTAMTATEVAARERLSYIGQGDRKAVFAKAIRDYILIHLATEEAAGLKGAVRPPSSPVAVELSDGIAEGPESVARTIQLLDAARAISIETKVRMAHPNWDEDEINAEVRRIAAEQQQQQQAVLPSMDDTLFTGE